MKRKAIFLLYRVLQALASPVILAWLVVRGLRNRRWLATIGERLGDLPSSWQQTVSASIWFHAVSVGEVLAAIPLLEAVRKRTPDTPLFVSVSTLAGYETAEKRLVDLADGVFFAPLDFAWSVRRVLRRLRPSAVVILETEIWPNLFRESKRVECALMMVNGRISDRARPRYRRLSWLFSSVLELSDAILVQSEEMRVRFLEAGAPLATVTVGGNLKYDLAPPSLGLSSPILRFVEANPNRHIWIAASTSADDVMAEEDHVIAAQHGLPGWRLILAPRKPERFDDIARRLEQSSLRWTRRSDLDDPAADVLLLDSIGELSGVFPFAHVVFMGGTLADRGGHNVLEPAMFGKPVIAGPHMENFREIADHFEKKNALRRISAGEQLRDAVLDAAADPGLGERARAAAAEERGAAARTADRLMALYDSTYPSTRRAQPAYAFLWMLSLIWRAASRWDRSRKSASARRLPAPVVSIGNITVGGTGKTPVTIELLRSFAKRRPGLLTRGHGRNTRENVLLTGDAELPVSMTGDEAQLVRRATGVPVGIGAERYNVGTLLMQSVPAGILFLDDGFQHLQLRRDFDLVLIDALSPFGGGHQLPLGRLREPLEGLRRAKAFIITRANEVPNVRAIENIVRRHNRHAPVFRAHTAPRRWVSLGGETVDLSAPHSELFVAFCGLGNPESFWRSLDRLGVELLDKYEYDDHHRYTPTEIRRLARYATDVGANTLLTTAKDAVNLPTGYEAMIGSLKLYWLEIAYEIDKLGELCALIDSGLALGAIPESRNGRDRESRG